MDTTPLKVFICVLAKDCNEAGYVRLVESLCNEHQIKLLKVGGKMTGKLNEMKFL